MKIQFLLDIACKVLVDSMEEIKEYFAQDYFQIANKLQQKKVITEEEKRAITDRNTGQNEAQRMEEIMKHVKVAVKVKESAFSLFVDILNEKGTLAAIEFAQKLKQRYVDKVSSETDLELSSKKAKQYKQD